MRNLRILTFSALYPSSVRPGHGIFVETRLRELLRSTPVVSKVVAPVPWFFSRHPRFGEYSKIARTPHRETLNGIDVLHPRFAIPPKIGMNIAPFLLAMSAKSTITQLLKNGFEFDLIDAHYFYPDGVAAAMLAAYFRKPFVVTARGSDITLLPRYAIPRKLIQCTSKRAGALVSVSQALADELVALGADRHKVNVLRNGVDLVRFRPMPRSVARSELGWPDQPTLVSVGNLNRNKGHHLIIEALRAMPDFRLALIGNGPERETLAELAKSLGVENRVELVGEVQQSDLFRYFSAADISVLASEREGWPNVLLESMACGTPVVVTRIWGTPEIVKSSDAGRFAEERSASGIAVAVRDLMESYPDRAIVRKYAEEFGWEATSKGQYELFCHVLGANA